MRTTARENGSAKATREKLRTKKKARKKAWRHVKRNKIASEAAVIAQSPTLRGDEIDVVPQHLSLSRMLGNKYMPFPDMQCFLSRLSKSIPHEFEDLKRVLVWTTFHDRLPSSSKDSYPSFADFPHRRMYVKKGTTPNASVEEQISQQVWCIDISIKLVLNQVRTSIEHCHNNMTLRGPPIQNPPIEVILV